MVYGWCFQDLLRKVTVAEMVTHYVYQQKNPPLHQLVAHYLGVHDKKSSTPGEASKTDTRPSSLKKLREQQLGTEHPTPPPGQKTSSGASMGAGDGNKAVSLKELRKRKEEK